MEPDILGNGFEKEILPLRDDYEGKVIATLIRKRGKGTAQKAVLYVHGYVDYFFQEEMADRYLENGYDFYALDLRKYGRSILPHQTPNLCNDISEYFEELDKAIGIIRDRDGVQQLLLNGHSTGGLISAIYTDLFQHGNRIQGLFLNSPFFEFNENWFTREVLLELVGEVGKARPSLEVPGGVSDLYGQSLHRDYKGEWEYNLEWKPINGFPVCAGWIGAIQKAQDKLQSGLDIGLPTLVMYSTESSKFKSWDDRILETDAVLNVVDIDRYADVLGSHAIEIRISGGVHDLMLSSKPVRENVYDELFSWLSVHIK